MVQWSQNVGSIYCTSNTYIKVCRLDLDSLPEDDGADLEGVGAAVLTLQSLEHHEVHQYNAIQYSTVQCFSRQLVTLVKNDILAPKSIDNRKVHQYSTVQTSTLPIQTNRDISTVHYRAALLPLLGQFSTARHSKMLLLLL